MPRASPGQADHGLADPHHIRERAPRRPGHSNANGHRAREIGLATCCTKSVLGNTGGRRPGAAKEMRFFKRIFGPSQEEVWRRVSSEMGAEFIKGGFFKGVNRVEARVKDWA